MLNKLCIKRVIMLSIFFILFFSFNIEVMAAATGTCEYELTGEGENANGYLKLTQDKNGKHTYKYKVKDKGAKWVTITNGKKITSGGKNKRMKRTFKVTDKSGDLGKKLECPDIYASATDDGIINYRDGTVTGNTKKQIFYIYIPKFKSNCDKEQWKKGYKTATQQDASTSYGKLKKGDKITCKYTTDASEVPQDYYNIVGQVDVNTFKNGGKTFPELKCPYTGDKKYTFLAKQSKKGKWTYAWAHYHGTDYKSIKNATRFNDGYLFEVNHKNAQPANECPSAIVRTPDSLNISKKYILDFDNPTKITGDTYNSKVEEGKVDEEALRMIEGKDLSDINSSLIGEEIETKSCQEILGDDLIEKIQEIVNMVRIMIPILLIVFGIIDFGKAIFVSDENEMKKSQSKFIRRLIIAVGFFMVPSILSLVLNIANKVWEVIPDAENAFCGIKF